MAKVGRKERSIALYETILKLKDLDECCLFFDDLCIPRPLRWGVNSSDAQARSCYRSPDLRSMSEEMRGSSGAQKVALETSFIL